MQSIYLLAVCALLLLYTSSAKNPFTRRNLHNLVQKRVGKGKWSWSGLQLLAASQDASEQSTDLSQSVDFNDDDSSHKENEEPNENSIAENEASERKGDDASRNVEKNPAMDAVEEEVEFSALDTMFELPTATTDSEDETASQASIVDEEAISHDVVEEEVDVDESFTSLDTFPDTVVDVVHEEEGLTTEESVEEPGVPAEAEEEEVTQIAEIMTNEVASHDPVVDLFTKYKHRMVLVNVPQYPHCEIYLCGTLHVSETSVEMVQEAIRTICPHFVILELCDGRLEGLLEDDDVGSNQNMTLLQVVQGAVQDRSIKTFGMGLLTWMQIKAAKTMGSKLGGELCIAAKEAHRLQSRLILGDRSYAVTIQRIFDRLTWSEKVKMIVVMIWETLTMSLFKLKDYIHKSQQDDDFIADELQRFAKYLPNFADVVIQERDEYLAQTIHEVASVGFGRISPALVSTPRSSFERKGKIIAVVGAGHLPGIQRHLLSGGMSLSRMQEISSSSKHVCTWPGSGVLQVVDTNILFNQSLGSATAPLPTPSPSS